MPYTLDDRSLLWVLHDGGGVVRSTDGGRTWEQWSYAPLVSGIVAVDDGLLAATTADQVVVSADEGETWTWLGPAAPFRPASFTYSAADRTFYVSHWDCGDVVLPDAVAALSLVGG